MTDSEKQKARKEEVARYRALQDETTDPLATGLLRDIILELEADLEEVADRASTNA